MNWLNIAVSFLRSSAFVSAVPLEQATWLSLIAYCVEQENGGRIEGGAKWKDVQWQRSCGVSARAVRSASVLIRIEGDDVVIHGYPEDKEREVKARRVQAADAARSRWSNAPRIPPRNAPRIHQRTAEEKENEKEKERDAASALARSNASLVLTDQDLDGLASEHSADKAAIVTALTRWNDRKAAYPQDENTLPAFRGWLRTSPEAKAVLRPVVAPAAPKPDPVPLTEPAGWREDMPADDEDAAMRSSPWEQIHPYYQARIARKAGQGWHVEA